MSEKTRPAECFGYVFRDPALLEEALTHKSHLQGKPASSVKNNERLEFLGDAVVGLVISDLLAATFPEASEGELSKIKAGLVSRASLGQAAQRLDLGSALRLGRGELATGRAKRSLLGNALEAVIGAVYADGGFEAAQSFVLRVLDVEISAVRARPQIGLEGDFKSQLQEWCQKTAQRLPVYSIIREEGPDHDKLFEVRVGISGKIFGEGVGKSKKEAEQRAAKQALENVRAKQI